MTEPKLESIKEISDYLDMKYKTKLLWINFTEKKRDMEWYENNTPLFITLCKCKMTEFYVIMVKRQDGKVYADLHKTNEVIYLTIEDAYEEWNNTEHYKEYYHIVKLIACLPETLEELAQEHSPDAP